VTLSPRLYGIQDKELIVTARNFHYRKYMFAAGLLLAASGAIISAAEAAAQDYRFELAGKPVLSAGKGVVQVRLVHATDGKPVPDAVIFESKADMGPSGMASMTGPVKALPAKDGVFSFEVDPAAAGSWALHLAAKVQGEPETVRGTVNADLVK
jgi:YtkA-like